jgi:hypothetical protein
MPAFDRFETRRRLIGEQGSGWVCIPHRFVPRDILPYFRQGRITNQSRKEISGEAMTARDALVQLFELLFGHADLQRFVESRIGAAGIEGVGAAVEALELQGAVDAALFDGLGADFPSRAREIERVARRWLPDRSVAIPPARPAATAAPETGVWDIFLAHAAPDAPAAEALHDALGDTGLAVFLDSRCVRLGERWDDVIPAALGSVRLIVVLVSGRTRDAWYAREEIALAIEAARGRSGPDRVPPLVIPVYLERMPAGSTDWLYGLHRLQGMVAADVGWPTGVAGRLVERFDTLDDPDDQVGGGSVADADAGEPRPGPGAGTPPPTTLLQHLHLAMDLDRSDQWLALLRESRSERSGILLLHGERRQNLELFVARLWQYLSAETERHHHIIQVPERWEAEPPRTAAGWEINLRHAFPNGQGTAADLLAEVARNNPILLLIGKHPLSRDGLDDDEEVIAALEEFLNERLPALPALLAGCPGPHPVRALVATDHERPQDALADRLYVRMQRGAERHGIRVRRLPEVQHVTWGHIQGYLDGLDPPPETRVYETLKQVYERLDHDRISFQELAERLSRKL